LLHITFVTFHNYKQKFSNTKQQLVIFYSEKNGKKKTYNPTAAGFGRDQRMDGSGTHSGKLPRPSTSKEEQRRRPQPHHSGSTVTVKPTAVQPVQSYDHRKHKAG